MTRSIILALVIFFVPALASAQAPRAHDDASAQLSLSPDYAAELASIDAESHAATALYVTAVTLHVGGLAVGVIGGFAGMCFYSCGDGQRAAQMWSAAGFVVSAVGLLTFIPAIALDVDSGNRRHRLMETHVALSVGAGTIGIEGTF